MTLDEIFKTAVDRKASDVHLMADEPVVFRINGILIRQNDWPVLKKQEIFSLAQSVLDERAKRRLEKDKEADLSYEKGLILVTGPTGCGKSTTLAAMVDWLDNHYPYHIITLEDPIEFSFTPHKSLISQREMGKDFVSFAQALRHIVRQDPNVIMVGEMRDLETISLVTTLAETGHLILATLHTPNAPQTIDRIVDVFPSSQQPQIRLQLALCLKAIIAQQLVPHLSGGRIAAREVMINTPAVATLIRENKIVNISNVIQTGAKDGMQTMDQDLEKLYQLKQISRETLQSFATYPIN